MSVQKNRSISNQNHRANARGPEQKENLRVPVPRPKFTECLIYCVRSERRGTGFHVRVDLLQRDLAGDRVERDHVVTLVIDAIDPLLLILFRVVFNPHFVLLDQQTFLDAG